MGGDQRAFCHFVRFVDRRKDVLHVSNYSDGLTLNCLGNCLTFGG